MISVGSSEAGERYNNALAEGKAQSCDATQSRPKRLEQQPQNKNGRDPVNRHANTGIEAGYLFLSAGYTHHDAYNSPGREQPDNNSPDPPHNNLLALNG